MRRALLIALALVIAANGTAEAKHHRRHHAKIIVHRMSEQAARWGVEQAGSETCAEDPNCVSYGAVIVDGALSCDHETDFEWACFGYIRTPEQTCQFREYVRVGGVRYWDDTYGTNGYTCQ